MAPFIPQPAVCSGSAVLPTLPALGSPSALRSTHLRWGLMGPCSTPSLSPGGSGNGPNPGSRFHFYLLPPEYS